MTDALRAFWRGSTGGRRLGQLRIATGILVVASRLGLHGLAPARLGAGLSLHEFSPRTFLYAGFRGAPVGLQWLPCPTFAQSQCLDLLVFALAAAFTLGLATPLVTVALAGLLGYPFLLSLFAYSHHRLLLVLMVLVVGLGGGGRRLAVMPASGRSQLAPLRLVQLLVTTVYTFAFLFKLNASWTSGAIFTALVDNGDLGGPGPWMLSHLGAPLLGWGTLAIELFVAAALWSPRLRRGAALVGLLFHVGIDLCLDVGMYSYQMLVMYAAFWPDLDGAATPNERATIHSSDAL